MGAAKSAKGANPKCTGAADPKYMVQRAKKPPLASAKKTRGQGHIFDRRGFMLIVPPPHWFPHCRDEDSNPTSCAGRKLAECTKSDSFTVVYWDSLSTRYHSTYLPSKLS